MVKLMSEIKFIVRPRKKLKTIRIPEKLLNIYRLDAEYYEVTITPLVKLRQPLTGEPKPESKPTTEIEKKKEEEEEFW